MSTDEKDEKDEKEDIHFLLYGHRGWIGSQIVDHIKKLQKECKTKNIKYTLSTIRVSNHNEVEKEICTVSPTHIISTIGRTHGKLSDGTIVGTIDYLESLDKVYENIHDNLFAAMILSLLSIKHKIHFTYMGTGCIFHHHVKNKNDDDVKFNDIDDNDSYDTDTQFFENDLPNFTGSQYSMVKGFTDQLMQIMEFNKNILNVRIRMPISDRPSPRNLITKLIGYKKIVNVLNSMTVLDDLLPIMIDMAINRRYGTINLVNKGALLHRQILEIYKEVIDNKHEWEDITVKELQKVTNVKAQRSNNCLSTKKLESWYPNQIKPIDVSIRDTLIRMKNQL